MTAVLAITVAVVFGTSIYLLLGRELKGVAIGVFLVGHAANLSIIAMSGSPIYRDTDGLDVAKVPPIASKAFYTAVETTTRADGSPARPLDLMVDPLPQALILTAIVIGFAVMGFLLTLLVVTQRTTDTLNVNDLAKIRPEATAVTTPDADVASHPAAG